PTWGNLAVIGGILGPKLRIWNILLSHLHHRSSRRTLPLAHEHDAIFLQAHPDDVDERPLRVARKEMSPNLQHSQAKVRRILEVCRSR
ncbi:hypothetical protein, partial [Corallococcus sp. CA053C]|uniref:hypothetical protein n=1 Tax=Corallococcus sp. CA053C TaxID=2316732 RepID=UPI001F1AFDE5